MKKMTRRQAMGVLGAIGGASLVNQYMGCTGDAKGNLMVKAGQEHPHNRRGVMNRHIARDLLRGPIPSIRTPFNRDGSVDFTGMRRMIDFCIKAGSKSIMLTAGDSHYFCLSDEEILQITRVATDQIAGRAIIIAADRLHSTTRAIEFAKYCNSVGVDVYMALPPDWAGSCTPQTLADHYVAIAEYIPLMIVTGIFIPRGMDFGIETITIATEKSQNIVAIKDDMCGKFGQHLCMELGKTLPIIAGGQKINHLDMWPYGCNGYLSTFMTFKPKVAQRYWQAIDNKNIDEASQIIQTIDVPFFKHIMSYPGGFDAAMHGINEIFKLAGRWRRKPYYTLNDEELLSLSNFLTKMFNNEFE